MLTREAIDCQRSGMRFHEDCSIVISDMFRKIITNWRQCNPDRKTHSCAKYCNSLTMLPPMVDSPNSSCDLTEKIKFEIIEISALDVHNI